MPDDQNTTKNQISTENSIPPSPQEPMANIPINTRASGSSNMPPEAPESPKNADIPVSFNNANPENSPVLTENPEVVKPAESTSLEAENPKVEPISEPAQAPETQTAQMAGNEPLATKPETNTEPNVQEVKPEPVSVSTSGEAKYEPEKIIPVVVVVSNKNKILELLAKAKNAIQFRKRKKLDKVMTMFLKKSKITNDDVELPMVLITGTTLHGYLSGMHTVKIVIKNPGK
jgi:hypothetical protein